MRAGKPELFRVREYVSKSEIRNILRLAKMTSYHILKKSRMHNELGLDGNHSSELVKYMSLYPGLIARPLIVEGSKILVGKALRSKAGNNDNFQKPIKSRPST